MKKVVLLVTLIVFAFTASFATVTAPTVASSNGMVAAVDKYAAEVGAKILEMGGNAVDAAIAVSFALGVVEPYASGLGGEGYAVITMADGSKFAIDFRSAAPMAASYEALSELGLTISKANYTPKGACVPGVLAGIKEAWLLGATLPLADLIQPAIDLARNGFIVDETFAQTTSDKYELVLENGFDFLNEGFVWEVGSTFTNPQLAETLERIKEEGIDTFYSGSLADEIEEFMIENGGFMRKSDLEMYRAIVREPLHGTYRGYDFYVPHPPVSGPQFIAVLNTLENYNLPAMSWDDPLAVHIIQQALVLGDVDRRAYISDPEFYDLPYEAFMSKEYAKTRFMAIDLSQAFDPASYYDYQGDAYPFADGSTYEEVLLGALESVAANESGVEESPSTTHFSIVDKDGNAVAWTQTISSFFGTSFYFKGFFFNNEMANFASSYREGDVINLTGGMRPRTTICPTIIQKDGKVRWVIGTPGAGRIIPTMVQLAVDLIDFNMPVDQAIRTPKFVGYTTYKDLRIEEGYPQTTLDFLEKVLGHQLNVYSYPDLFFGGPNLVSVEENGLMIGAGSIRRGGSASAPEF